MHRIPIALRPVLARLVVFLFLFIGITGIVGPWIVTSKLLYGYGFFIYGNMGKLVILMTLVFPLFIREKLTRMPPLQWHKQNMVFVVASFLALISFFPVAQLTLSQSPVSVFSLGNLASHLLLVAIPLFALFAVFGYRFIFSFVRVYQKELTTCFLLGAVLYAAIFQVWKLWPIFSHGVLTAVAFLFQLTFEHVSVIPPRILKVESFAVKIEQACSGLDSLFLFSSLFGIIGYLERKLFDRKKYFIVFVCAAGGLYLVNIIRVYLIILYGVLVSPETAIKLFHTYAGMVLFIIYFAILIKGTYRWMKKN